MQRRAECKLFEFETKEPIDKTLGCRRLSSAGSSERRDETPQLETIREIRGSAGSQSRFGDNQSRFRTNRLNAAVHTNSALPLMNQHRRSALRPHPLIPLRTVRPWITFQPRFSVWVLVL